MTTIKYQSNYKIKINKYEIKSYQRLLEQIKFEKAKSEYTDREVRMALLY